jgi:hypothetical protein
MAGAGGELRHRPGVNPGMLADVEGVQVQAEGGDLAPQGVDQAAGQARPVLAVQAAAEQFQVAEQGVGIGIGRRVPRFQQGSAQTVAHDVE